MTIKNKKLKELLKLYLFIGFHLFLFYRHLLFSESRPHVCQLPHAIFPEESRKHVAD